MSLKFQTRKWDVEITWEQMTLTPLGNATGHHDAPSTHHNTQDNNNTNYFLFNLIEQIFPSSQRQEHLSQ